MGDASAPTDRVALAAGMVAMQADCSIGDALDKMRDTAAQSDCTLEELAGLVIDHEITFSRR